MTQSLCSMFTVVYIDHDGELQHIKKRRPDGVLAEIVQDLFKYEGINPNEVLSDGDTVLILWRDSSRRMKWTAPIPKGRWSVIY